MKRKILLILINSDYQLLNALVAKEKQGILYTDIFVVFSGYWNKDSFIKKNLVYGENIKFFRSVASVKNKISDCDVDIISAKYEVKHQIIFKASRYICIDDGLGSYGGFFHLYRAAIRERNSYKIYLGYPVYWFFQKFALFFSLYKREKMYVNGKVDPKYKSLFCEVVSRIAYNNKIKKDTDYCDKNVLVFCSQPYIELGILSDSEYKELLASIESYWNSKILVLRHPGDKVFNYSSYKVIEGDMFEAFALNNLDAIQAVLSINSTCLLTASSIFDIPSYSVTNKKLKNVNMNFSKDIKRLWSRYVVKIVLE